MRQRLLVLLIALFFLGLPVAGLVFVWKYAHANIEKSADPFARKVVVDVLDDWDVKLLDELGTLEYRKSDQSRNFSRQRDKLGKFVSLSSLKTHKSTVGERGETIWQFVHYIGTAQYQKGSADVRFTIARRTMNPEWRMESFELVPK